MAEYLDTKEGLSFLDGDKELYKMLLDAYAHESKFDPNALKDFIKKKEFASQRSPEEMAALAQDFCDAYQKCLEEAEAAASELQ